MQRSALFRQIDHLSRAHFTVQTESRFSCEVKILALGASSALIAFLPICTVYLEWGGIGGPFPLRSLNAPVVTTQVKKLNQLAVVNYHVQHVVGMTEPKVPLGEESILLTSAGTGARGVHLAALTQNDVTITGDRTVTLRLPAAKLLNVFLDEKVTKVWEPPDYVVDALGRLRSESGAQSAFAGSLRG